jgi:hypothetical protein
MHRDLPQTRNAEQHDAVIIVLENQDEMFGQIERYLNGTKSLLTREIRSEMVG